LTDNEQYILYNSYTYARKHYDYLHSSILLQNVFIISYSEDQDNPLDDKRYKLCTSSSSYNTVTTNTESVLMKMDTFVIT